MTRTPMNASSQVCSVAGRILILLATLLLVVTPWTEYFWHFDNFLHGGQDMEFGLISIVTVLCLVLVLLQDGKQHMTSLVAICRWLSSILKHAAPSASESFFEFNPANTSPPPSSSLDAYYPPIRI